MRLQPNSGSLHDRGSALDHRDVGAGVYEVRGSITGHSEAARVIVELLNRLTGRHHWSMHVDLPFSSQGFLKDVIWLRLAARLSGAVRTAELERVRAVPIEQLDNARACLRAASILRRGQSGNTAALAALRRVIKSSPDHALAHGLAARSFHVQRMMGWLAPDDKRLSEGIDHANAAAVDSTDPEALWLSGLAIMNIAGDLARARRLIDRAIALNPASANAWTAKCFLDCHSGDAATAVADFVEARELDPDDISHHIQSNAAATAQFIGGNFEAAHGASEDCLAIRPGYTASLRIKVATAGLLGRSKEASEAARHLLAVEPKASVARMREYWRALATNAPQALDAKIEGWRRAGMPD